MIDMAETIRVRVVGAQFRYDYEQYERGAELTVLTRTLDRHPNTLEAIGQDDDDSDDDVDESDATAEVAADSVADRSLTDIDGVGDATAESLREAGYASFDALRDATIDDLVVIDGISESLATSITEEVQDE